jgi:hypothetical protein
MLPLHQHQPLPPLRATTPAVAATATDDRKRTLRPQPRRDTSNVNDHDALSMTAPPTLSVGVRSVFDGPLVSRDAPISHDEMERSSLIRQLEQMAAPRQRPLPRRPIDIVPFTTGTSVPPPSPSKHQQQQTLDDQYYESESKEQHQTPITVMESHPRDGVMATSSSPKLSRLFKKSGPEEQSSSTIIPVAATTSPLSFPVAIAAPIPSLPLTTMDTQPEHYPSDAQLPIYSIPSSIVQPPLAVHAPQHSLSSISSSASSVSSSLPMMPWILPGHINMTFPMPSPFIPSTGPPVYPFGMPSMWPMQYQPAPFVPVPNVTPIVPPAPISQPSPLPTVAATPVTSASLQPIADPLTPSPSSPFSSASAVVAPKVASSHVEATHVAPSSSTLSDALRPLSSSSLPPRQQAPTSTADLPSLMSQIAGSSMVSLTPAPTSITWPQVGATQSLSPSPSSPSTADSAATATTTALQSSVPKAPVPSPHTSADVRLIDMMERLRDALAERDQQRLRYQNARNELRTLTSKASITSNANTISDESRRSSGPMATISGMDRTRALELTRACASYMEWKQNMDAYIASLAHRLRTEADAHQLQHV